ncbi:hypothetical protein ACF07T_37730 [Streptomyces sp. NPDC015184]|uniref:hypothetical protein n=1 Tax=Streptomyces sp. NPDC015184 TaxID=3364946 RepID=UPI0036FB9814
MDQALAALLGAVVGSAGTATAAALTGISARWQVRTQGALQHRQAQRQARREAYSAFLADASHARDDLSAVWHQLRDEHADLAETERLLATAKTSVHAAQRAGATVTVEGPPDVVDATREALTNLAVLYAALGAYRVCRAENESTSEYIATCAQQRRQVRLSLDAFAAAAQVALSDPGLEGRRL